MARPTDLTKYPPQFFELLERFENLPEDSITVPMENGTPPNSLRLDLESFRAALRKNCVIHKYPNFDQAKILTGADKKSVTINRIDKTPNAQAVQKALDKLNSEETQPKE